MFASLQKSSLTELSSRLCDVAQLLKMDAKIFDLLASRNIRKAFAFFLIG
jgi:hypothetical protein